MTRLDDLAAADPVLARELDGLTADELQWLAEDQALRDQARELATSLGRDESDIYHQLKQLRRSPLERLRLGLAHGRRRPRPQ